METSTDAKDAPAGVECRPSKDPAVRLFIGAAASIAVAIWCLTDLRAVPDDWSLKNINATAGFLFNNVGPFFLFPAGVVLAVWGLVFLRRKLVADQAGLGYVGKEKIPWTDITSLDVAKFKKKGILGLRYTRDGKEKTFVLDSWKLDNFRQLIQLVEAKVPFALAQ